MHANISCSFQPVRRIGHGGQAEVFLGRTRGGGGLAALKVAHPGHAAGLHDEHGWLALPSTAHPHLPQLYTQRYGGRGDLGYLSLPGQPPRPFLALAYLPGQTVAAWLARRRGRGLAPHLACAIAYQAALALDHLHRQVGIVHYDVRPANLLVAPGRHLHVTLLDLGSAESLDAPRRSAIYVAPDALAPESQRGMPASSLVDVYALGVTLRTMLAGQPISRGLASLIAEATADDPRQRLPDMRAFIEHLARAA